MSQAGLMNPASSILGIESRRSTRLEHIVPLTISGQDNLGQSFRETTSAVSLNLHGCRYPSRHEYRIGSWVVLQVGDGLSSAPAPSARAQVRSIHAPESPRELRQVGVELEFPANIWGISQPPHDWQRLLGQNLPTEHAAAAVAPALGREAEAPSVAEKPPASEQHAARVVSFPSPPQQAPEAPPAQESAPAKSGRIAITPDQLITILQGKLQQAAEKAVGACLATHLEPAVRQALLTIDEMRQSNTRELESALAAHLDTLAHSARERENALRKLEIQVGSSGAGGSEHLFEIYRAKSDEIGRHLEKIAAAARQDLAKTQELLKNFAREFEPRISARLDEAVARAAKEFEGAAAQVADRQLVRLVEEAQGVTRDAGSRLDAQAADARSVLQSAARSTLDELRRQADVHTELALAETTQRVASSLASLDAENRAACDARRKNLEGEVLRAGEQLTEQFRKSLKAFFYSCLVAAVGAVEQHSQTTFSGLTRPGEEGASSGRAIAGDLAEGFDPGGDDSLPR